MPEGPEKAQGRADAKGVDASASTSAVGGPRPSMNSGRPEHVEGRRVREADLGPLPRRMGRYEVLERIGSGGMGTVFRARQLPIDRIVALKILSPDLAEDRRYIRRFVREARAAGAMNHPNVVLVHDVGRVEGHPYICMEHVDGTSVDRMLRERGRLAPEEAVSTAIDVARALERAHRAGIVHRDIKPGNILVDSHGVVKLADLGLAHQTVSGVSDHLTREGMGLGTPHYMAVEQARDARHADARSDIYSLGATLFHMVTGRVPFEGGSTVDILMRAAEEPLVSPEDIIPGLPESLSCVIQRMMAKDPGARYQDASSLLADLEAVRNELAGLGPARLAAFGDARRPAEGAGRMLTEVAVALAGLALAGLIVAAVGRGESSPAAEPFIDEPPKEPTGPAEPEGARAAERTPEAEPSPPPPSP